MDQSRAPYFEALWAHLAAQAAGGGRIVGPQDPQLGRTQVVWE